jgi:hypothetical protein
MRIKFDFWVFFYNRDIMNTKGRISDSLLLRLYRKPFGENDDNNAKNDILCIFHALSLHRYVLSRMKKKLFSLCVCFERRII